MNILLYTYTKNINSTVFNKQHNQDIAVRWKSRDIENGSFIHHLAGRILLVECLKLLRFEGNLQSIEYNKYEKPYLKNSKIKFNISHSSGLVVCIASDEEVELGIDVEKINDIEIDAFRQYFNDREWDKIIQSNNRDIFFSLWTKKEAIVKAAGTGLSSRVRRVNVLSDTAMLKHVKYYMRSIHISSDYIVHVASIKKLIEVSIKEIDLSKI